MTTDPARAEPSPSVMQGGRGIRRAVVGFLAAVILVVTALGASEWLAHRRAERARAALRVGIRCAELLAITVRFANEESVQEVKRVCGGGSGGRVTLNFSHGMSLNYLIEVDVSADGRLASVSEVGAW